MESEPNQSQPGPSEAIKKLKLFWPRGYFLPYQWDWIADPSSLKIIQKCRQAGITYADAYDSVIKASFKGARWDVWVSSRDEAQAKLYLEDCKHWASVLQIMAVDLGEIVFDHANNYFAYVLPFPHSR